MPNEDRSSVMEVSQPDLEESKSYQAHTQFEEPPQNRLLKPPNIVGNEQRFSTQRNDIHIGGGTMVTGHFGNLGKLPKKKVKRRKRRGSMPDYI